MTTRRQLLRNAFATAALATAGCGRRLAPARSASPAAVKASPGPVHGRARASAVIFLYMEGGPSQLDTWDPKPGTDEAAGVTALETEVPGLSVSQYLPRLARRVGDLAVIRSLVSKEGNHNRARHLMHTGYAPAGGIAYPAIGAIAGAELGTGPLPAYISIGSPGADAGLLGAEHAPFAVIDPRRPVRNLVRARGIDAERFEHRLAMWRQLEDGFARDRYSPTARSQRQVAERAIAMMSAAETVAFDLARESAPMRASYGDSSFGVGCLMARRLVEQGVRFVEVAQRGWDTHVDHAARIGAQCETLDRGMSALLADLAARNMLDSTLVVWAGDFGRTPLLSARGGRDHYPAVSSAVLAGGGVRGGQVIGRSDARGHAVVEGRIEVPDFFRSIADALGLDPEKTRLSPAGRPLQTIDGGRVPPSLFSTP